MKNDRIVKKNEEKKGKDFSKNENKLKDKNWKRLNIAIFNKNLNILPFPKVKKMQIFQKSDTNSLNNL